MKYCFYCGTKLDDDDVYCLNCGMAQDIDDSTALGENEDKRALNDDVKVNDEPKNFVERKAASDNPEKQNDNTVKKIVTAGVIAVCVCAIFFVGWHILTGNDVDNHAEGSNNEHYYSDTYNVEDYNDYEYDDDYSDCIFPYSSQAYIDETEAYYLTDDELQEAINELYARHGRIFDDEEIQAYFSSKSWYVPIARGIEKENFNEYEEYNWEILTKERKSREPDYD